MCTQDVYGRLMLYSHCTQTATCTTVCRTGALRIGDRILAINGVTLRGRNVEDAVRLLPTNDDSINIKVMRHLSSPPGLSLLYLSITLLCIILYFFLSFVWYIGGLAH